MEVASAKAGTFPSGRRTHYILLIDDNARLRSVFARHLMFACRERGHSCALYHISERGGTNLTFFDSAASSNDGNNELDFAVYEANSPRLALSWLRLNQLRRLAIVSDVMMPIDTEVGLEGLLDGLAELELAVGLVFVSSEFQSRAFVQNLLAPQSVHFVLKGGERWPTLPEALVQNIEALSYRPLKRKAEWQMAVTKLAENSYPFKPPTPSYMLKDELPSSSIKNQNNYNFEKNGNTRVGRVDYSPPKRSFWLRLLQLLRG